MTDPVYNGEFFIDPGIIKQEPFPSEPMISSSAVPIPARRALDMADLRDFSLELEACSSPSLQDAAASSLSNISTAPDVFFNGANMCKYEDSIKMEDDDIFQVDKADLIQGPTLAELNANDDTLLEDLNFDDLLLPEEKSYYINISPVPNQLQLKYLTPQTNTNLNNNNLFATSCPQNIFGFYKEALEPAGGGGSPQLEPFKSGFGSQGVPAVVNSPPEGGVLQQKHSTLHELLMKKEYSNSPERGLGQSLPSANNPMAGTSGITPHRTRSHSSRLSSSAPTHLGLEQIWQRREPRKHLLSTSSLVEAGSTSSLSTGGVLSPEAHDFSHDEGFDSEEDSEHYEDFSSDNESDDDGDATKSMSKKERYFWQYNVQAKGPKGQRLVLKTKMEDPHVLNEITDPVFSPNCAVRGIKHSGKARKGDGNDLTPNPRKLYNIGRELEKLGRIINDMTPVSELPFNVRPKTRKEKNKLASRACRLKKKAQHEANKLKLYGLEQEHKRLLSGICQVKQILAAKFGESSQENQEELNMHLEKATKSATKVKIAGHSTEYVNKVLDKVKSGIPGGGLEEIHT